MRKAESKFNDKIVADMRGLGAWIEKIQQVGKRGTPDFLICLNGHFLALESKKSDKEVPSKIQVLKLRKIKKAKGKAFVVCPENWQEIKAEIIRLTSLPV